MICVGSTISVLSLGLPPALALADEIRTFDIPAESAELSLRTFVQQAGLEVLYESGRLKPYQTCALKGDFERIDALKRLLSCSTLTYSRLNPRVLSIDPIPDVKESSTPAPATPVHELPVVNIVKVRYTEDGLLLPAGSTVQQIPEIDLHRQGFSTIADWARSLPQNQGSGATEDTLAFQREAPTNTAIGSGVNLFGIGQRATLILVNGRRLAPSGSAGSFTDISNLPISAVDHINIISDDASTVYGADAVGGIVDIVLHDPSSPPVTSVASSLDLNGPLGERSFSQAVAKAGDQFGGLLSFEYYDRKELPAFDRSQGTSDLQPKGDNFDSLYSDPATIVDSHGHLWGVPPDQNGTALTPAQLLPRPNTSDQIAGTWLLPHQERLNLLATANYQIADDWRLSLNSLINQRRFENIESPLEAVLSVPSSNPFYVNPVNGNSSPLVVLYNFGKDLGPTTRDGQVESGQFEVGLVHSWGLDWKLNGALGYAFEDQHIVQNNLVNFGILQQYLATPDRSQAFNPFADGSNTSAATLNAIRANGWARYGSAFTTADISASGKLPLPLIGPIYLTTGYEYRVQSFESTISPSLTSADVVPSSSPPTDKDRTLSALYLQTLVPVLTEGGARRFPVALNISGGVRYEHFSDAGAVATPSVGFELQLTADWQIKGSWARFFRPPNLPDLNEAPNISQTSLLPDPKSANGYTNTLVWSGNNSSLRAETARSWSLKTDYSPAPGIAWELDYFHIFALNEVIDRQQLVPGVFSNPQLSYEITRNLTPALQEEVCSHSEYLGAPGQCLSSSVSALVDLRIQDIGSLETDGFDISTKFSHDTMMGALGAKLSASYVLHFKVAQIPGDLISYRNTPHYPMALRFRNVFSWDWRGFFATPAINFQSGYVDTTSVPNRTVNPWVTWDMTLGFQRLRERSNSESQFSVTLRGFNVFNQQPPFVNNSLSAIPYDEENGDLLGRRVSLAIEYRW